MKKSLTVVITVGLAFCIKTAFSFPFNQQIQIDCPQRANIAAVDDGDWSGESSFVSLDLSDVSVGSRLFCVYKGCPSGVNYNLSQKVPEDYPYCFERADREGFICRNYRISGPHPVPPRYPDHPYPYPFPPPYPYPYR